MSDFSKRDVEGVKKDLRKERPAMSKTMVNNVTRDIFRDIFLDTKRDIEGLKAVIKKSANRGDNYTELRRKVAKYERRLNFE